MAVTTRGMRSCRSATQPKKALSPTEALEAAVELAFGTDRDAVGQLAERALGDARFDATAEYTTAPTNRHGKEAGVIFADGLDAQKMLAAGVGLVQEMRRQGI